MDEASRLGEVHVLLWSDALIRAFEGREPKFPQQERLYFLESIRYVSRVTLVEDLPGRDALPAVENTQGCTWVVDESGDNPARQEYCAAMGMQYHVVRSARLEGFPLPAPRRFFFAAGEEKSAGHWLL